MGVQVQGVRLVQLDGSIAVINEERLVAFFRAALNSTYPPWSVQEVCRHLDGDHTLQEVLDHLTKNGIEMNLSIRELGRDLFEITFGSVGSAFDDGGIWMVEYDAQHKVITLEQPGYWVGKRTGDIERNP